MNNTSNLTSECPSALAIVTVPGFQILVLLEILISAAAIIANVLFLSIIWRVHVFHVNLKLLLANFNFVLLAYTSGFFVKSLTTLITVRLGDACRFGMSAYDCKVRELLVAIPNSGVNYASLASCLERVYCTVRYKRYANSGMIKPWVSIFLIAACYATTFGHQLGMLANISRDRTTPFCENMYSTTPEAASIGTALSLSAEIVTVFLSITVYLYNKKQLKRSALTDRANEDLSTRYQLDQNVKINRLLTPAMVLEGICYMPTLAFLLLLARGVQFNVDTKTFCIHVTYNFKLLFAFAQPILGFALNPQMKKALKDAFPRLTSILILKTAQVMPEQNLNAAAAADAHFNQSAKLWSHAPSAKT